MKSITTRTILAAGLVIGWPILISWSSGQEKESVAEKTDFLNAEIKKLEETIEYQQSIIVRLNKALQEQIETNKRLQALCIEAGLQYNSSKDDADPNRYIVYRGKTRTKKWFEKMYEKCSDKYVFIDGQYINKTSLVKGEIETNKFWAIGSVVGFPYQSHVEKVLENGEVIISNDDGYGEKKVFHVHGLEHSYVVGERFPTDGTLFKCIGVFPYRYTTPRWTPGHHEYVENLYAISVIVYKPKPLTKTQFADAIESGLELIEYTELRGKTTKKLID